nr:MAG TPA: hypothetical protein [Caudoviricetes sp.]
MTFYIFNRKIIYTKSCEYLILRYFLLYIQIPPFLFCENEKKGGRRSEIAYIFKIMTPPPPLIHQEISQFSMYM